MGTSCAHGPSAAPAEAEGLPDAHGPPHGPPKVHGFRGHCTPLPPPLGGPALKSENTHEIGITSARYAMLLIIIIVFRRGRQW